MHPIVGTWTDAKCRRLRTSQPPSASVPWVQRASICFVVLFECIIFLFSVLSSILQYFTCSNSCEDELQYGGHGEERGEGALSLHFFSAIYKPSLRYLGSTTGAISLINKIRLHLFSTSYTYQLCTTDKYSE